MHEQLNNKTEKRLVFKYLEFSAIRNYLDFISLTWTILFGCVCAKIKFESFFDFDLNAMTKKNIKQTVNTKEKERRRMRRRRREKILKSLKTVVQPVGRSQLIDFNLLFRVIIRLRPSQHRNRLVWHVKSNEATLSVKCSNMRQQRKKGFFILPARLSFLITTESTVSPILWTEIYWNDDTWFNRSIVRKALKMQSTCFIRCIFVFVWCQVEFNM